MCTKYYEMYDGNNSIGEISWSGNEIRIVQVNRQYRGKGYGGLLLKHAEEDIKKKYNCVHLLAYPFDHSISQSELLKFYSKNGYKPFSFFMRWRYWIRYNRLVKYF